MRIKEIRLLCVFQVLSLELDEKGFRDFEVILLFSFFSVFSFTSILYLVAGKRGGKKSVLGFLCVACGDAVMYIGVI